MPEGSLEVKVKRAGVLMFNFTFSKTCDGFCQ